MSSVRPGQGSDPLAFLVRARGTVADPEVHFRLGPADRPMVAPGDAVEPGQPILERCREVEAIELPARGELALLPPGSAIDPSLLPSGGLIQRHQNRPGDRARLLSVSPDGIARVVLGRSPEVVTCPVPGVVDGLTAGRLSIGARCTGLPGRVGWGEPVIGRLVIGVPAPDAELRAPAIDIAAAGSILVAGARVDIEALTRARAIGVAGVISGGMIGRELGLLAESDRRQRAALHAASPFAVVALDGYGRRIVPGPAWERLVAAEGALVALFPDQSLVLLAPDAAEPPSPTPATGAALLTGGESAGRIVRLVGLAGPVRVVGAGYLPGGFIEEETPEGEVRRRIVPLSDLERLA